MENQPQTAIHKKLHALAATDPEEFRQTFKKMRKLFPAQAVEACLWYIASHGVDPASQSMAFWISSDNTYIAVLIDAKTLPVEIAAKAIAVLQVVDPQFTPKFSKALSSLTSPDAILRAQNLLPAMGDYSVLLPWLRSLSQNGDVRVRSRSAKLLCELRPNKSQIERQLRSEDARVRADAVQVLWSSKVEGARALLKEALRDSNHRVVGNALVGLHHMGDTGALNQMIELCAHKDYLFRAAMAWSMGFVKDTRAIPTLQYLTNDPSPVVRKRAIASLGLLDAIKAQEESEKLEAQQVTADQIPQQPATAESDTVNPYYVSWNGLSSK